MKKLLLSFIVLLLLAGCMPVYESASYEGAIDSTTSLVRIVDKDAEVICWVAKFNEAVGISCLPYQQVNNPNSLPALEFITK